MQLPVTTHRPPRCHFLITQSQTTSTAPRCWRALTPERVSPARRTLSARHQGRALVMALSRLWRRAASESRRQLGTRSHRLQMDMSAWAPAGRYQTLGEHNPPRPARADIFRRASGPPPRHCPPGTRVQRFTTCDGRDGSHIKPDSRHTPLAHEGPRPMPWRCRIAGSSSAQEAGNSPCRLPPPASWSWRASRRSPPPHSAPGLVRFSSDRVCDFSIICRRPMARSLSLAAWLRSQLVQQCCPIPRETWRYHSKS